MATNYPNQEIPVEVNLKQYKLNGLLGDKFGLFHNIQTTEGDLIDFETSEIDMDLNHPVEIDVQPSYDGTVNLILNDDKNAPRIINSRFTVREDNKFEIIDRKGDDDTNIYSQGNIDLQTRLFKNANKIPCIKFKGLDEGGNLSAGNYVFYFKFSDADGNESDIVAESGIIPVHDGLINDPYSMQGGILHKNCNKTISLTISNLDDSYDFLNIYYSVATSDNNHTNNINLYKLQEKKRIASNSIEVILTGYENVETLTIDSLNTLFNIVERVKTLAQVQNMLFFANVDSTQVPYEDLQDISLRIYPIVTQSSEIGLLDHEYKPVNGITKDCEYYNVENIYNSTGYWDNEMYRLGIIYILKDDTLSPVFNIRGTDNLDNDYSIYREFSVLKDNKRNYIEVDESGFIVTGKTALENSKGVIRIKSNLNLIETKTRGIDKTLKPLGLKFKIPADVRSYITEKLGIKGFFFVRLKRIPTVLGQAFTAGYDTVSYLPCLKTSEGYIQESFLDRDRILGLDFERHKIVSNSPAVIPGVLYAPEIAITSLADTGLFTAGTFTITNSNLNNTTKTLQRKDRHFFIENYESVKSLTNIYKDNKLTYVENDSVLRFSGNRYYSSKAGIAEEATKFKYFAETTNNTDSNNLVRGNYSAFIGCDSNLVDCKIVNIHIPGYDYTKYKDYFNIRFNANYPYFAIGNRYDLTNTSIYDNVSSENMDLYVTEYRGDCYINTVTVRVNRNFIDPEVPINDTILDTKTWKDNYKHTQDYNNKKDPSLINRADVNTVSLGMWVTFKIQSTNNLALRSLDFSDVDEISLLGQPKGYYPIHALSPRAENKASQSTLFNNGYSSTTGDKLYLEMPDVPYIKSIFDNRIMFSNKHVNDAFLNGYRIFQGLSYQDLSMQYGAITKILEYLGNILIVFEYGVGLLPINEKALITTESGQSVHMYGAGVLPEKETIVSQDYGSRWKDSIVRTPYAIYGVDSIAKKIWRFSSKGFEMISDFTVQSFLNDNLKIPNEKHYPVVGYREIKTHYNNFKGDVIFSYYDENNKWSITYNERLNTWVTRNDWNPLLSQNINNTFLSYPFDTANNIARSAMSLADTKESKGIVCSNNIIGLPCDLYIKGYDYLLQNNPTIIYEVNGVTLEGNVLNTTKYTEPINLKVKATITSKEGSSVVLNDWLYLTTLEPQLISLYKHGFTNMFNNTEKPKYGEWYDETRPFEIEFVVNENISILKIFNNLKIISNKALPNSLEITINGESYTNYMHNTDGDLVFKQEIKDITNPIFGRLRGNTMYKENAVDILINPTSISNSNIKSTRIRDKYAIIRLIYTGNDPVIINLIQTFYTISYA